jgi:hypothetical protein
VALLLSLCVHGVSMHKHVQGRTPFLPPLASSHVWFFKFLLIYSKPCLVQLSRLYSFILFKKYHDLPSTTSCEGAAVVFAWVPKVKVTLSPIKKTEIRNSQGFNLEVRKIPSKISWPPLDYLLWRRSVRFCQEFARVPNSMDTKWK